jgi:hypothetical protein
MRIHKTTRTIDGKLVRFEYWYDRSVRVWFAIPVNDEGHQIGDTLDAYHKDGVLRYLDTYCLFYKGES